MDVDELIIPRIQSLNTLGTEIQNILGNAKSESSVKSGLSNQTINLQKTPNRTLQEQQCPIRSVNLESGKDINWYKKSIENLLYKSKPKSLSFRNGFYLENRVVELILTTVSQILKNIPNMMDFIKSLPRRIEVRDPFPDADSHYANNYTFFIYNQKEITHATALINLYIDVVKPFLEKNKERLDHLPSNANRYFFITGNKWVLGKTIHDTSEAITVGHHWADDRFRKYEYFNIRTSLGHLSHFRTRFYHLDPIPLSHLHFDFNYFSCYVEQLLRGYEQEIKNDAPEY